MARKLAFAGIRLALAEGWIDITNDLPANSPPTLARADGVGALQFSIARHSGGKNPGMGEEDVFQLLCDFAVAHRLGEPVSIQKGTQRQMILVEGLFSRTHLGECLAWYVSDGHNLALVTYVAEVIVAREVADARAMVHSICF